MKSLHISLTMLIWRLKLWTISNNYKNRLDFFPGFYLVSLWYACVMVLNFAYSSNLRAFIVLPDPGRLIDSDTDVLKSNARVFYPGYSDQVKLWKNRTSETSFYPSAKNAFDLNIVLQKAFDRYE